MIIFAGMIKRIIANYIEQESLANHNETLIIGLSGGADSVALLLILHELGYNCVGAHCNFHLRDEESNRDQAFVERLCKTYNIPLYIEHFNTKEYASQQRISIEMAARDLRYAWFNRLLDENKGDKVAIAHHRDDNIETLILNLARGTGLKGLTGIQPLNGKIIRPLLCISRDDIESYLGSLKQSYVTDSTNLEDEFARNKVRIHIIPALEEINSACKNNIQNTIGYLNEIQVIYNKAIEEAINRVRIDNEVDIELLKGELSPKTILYEICYPIGFNSTQVEELFKALDSRETKIFYSASHEVIVNRDKLTILKKDDSERFKQMPPQLIIEYKDVDKNFRIPKDKCIACFDAQNINEDDLQLCKWNQGDYFVPFGMTGRKNLSDFFTDNKYSVLEKESQWLLKHKSDIIWVVGKRSDNRYRITPATRKVIIIRIASKDVNAIESK